MVLNDLKHDGAHDVCFLLTDLFVLVTILTYFQTYKTKSLKANQVLIVILKTNDKIV